jgi:hypothetical protein
LYKEVVPKCVLGPVALWEVRVLSVLFRAEVSLDLIETDDRSYLTAVVQEVKQLFAEARKLFDVVLVFKILNDRTCVTDEVIPKEIRQCRNSEHKGLVVYKAEELGVGFHDETLEIEAATD